MMSSKIMCFMLCIECVTLRKCNCAILTGNTTNDPSLKVVDPQVIERLVLH